MAISVDIEQAFREKDIIMSEARINESLCARLILDSKGSSSPSEFLEKSRFCMVLFLDSDPRVSSTNESSGSGVGAPNENERDFVRIGWEMLH